MKASGFGRQLRWPHETLDSITNLFVPVYCRALVLLTGMYVQ